MRQQEKKYQDAAFSWFCLRTNNISLSLFAELTTLESLNPA